MAAPTSTGGPVIMRKRERPVGMTGAQAMSQGMLPISFKRIAVAPACVSVYDRRVRMTELERSLYSTMRMWVRNDPSRMNTSAAPSSTRSVMTLPEPSPHTEGSKMRVVPEPKQTSKDEILNGQPGIPAGALLESHLSYFKELKKWYRMQHGYKLARYRDRLGELNLKVPSPDPLDPNTAVAGARVGGESTSVSGGGGGGGGGEGAGMVGIRGGATTRSLIKPEPTKVFTADDLRSSSPPPPNTPSRVDDRLASLVDASVRATPSPQRGVTDQPKGFVHVASPLGASRRQLAPPSLD